MTTPENSSARDPLLHVLGAMSGGTDRYITDMESAGQRQLVNSDTLPADAPWDDLAALGFVPGEVAPGDEMFRHATLPEGWKREGSDHAMWSYIVDERGVRRVAVFYKAAFYDRRAFARLENVGNSLAGEAIYGDGPVSLPDSWPVLNDGERAAFREALSDYLTRAEEHPTIYGDRVTRVRAFADLAAS